MYHPSIERYVLLRDFIISKISRDDQWLIRIVNKLKPKIFGLIVWCEKIKSEDWENRSAADSIKLVNELFEKMNEIGPSFLIDLSFPFQMENYPEAGKYEASINAAIAVRGEVEKLGPIVNDLTITIAEEAMRRAGIKNDFLNKYLTLDEIRAMFLDKKINKKKIEKRKEYFLLSLDGFSRESVEDFMARKGWSLKKYNAESTAEIKGSIACAGKSQGMVKIVLSNADFEKVEAGDIIVSSMTTPDYLPVLKKAAAIVTDEGGITCHAAIVSREMKKPCIIGTKIATKVLHDGDLVEVDADKGIVKIISK